MAEFTPSASRQPDQVLDDGDGDRDQQGVPDRLHGVGVVPHLDEVVQADERELGVETVPVGEGVVQTAGAGHQDDEGEQDQRRQREPPRWTVAPALGYGDGLLAVLLDGRECH
jgi:hypothetical protein